jgi:drug/metabolite transporter (DMT)-like permease
MEKKVLFAEASLLVITLIWGLGFPITKIAIELGYGPNTIMVGRFVTATVILGVVYHKAIKKINKTILIYGSITGVFLFLGFYFQTLGNVYTTASKNGFITQLNIVFVPYLYYLFFRRKVDVFNILSVGIATIGLFVLTYNQSEFIGFNIGDLYTLICAVMVAFHIVTGSFFQKKYDFNPAVFVFVNILIAGILSLIFMLFTETMPSVGIIDLWPLLFLGVLNTALGFLVQSYTLKISVPTRVSLIVTLESLFAAIGSVLILGEAVTVPLVIGGFLIMSAVAMSELKPFKRKVIRPT